MPIRTKPFDKIEAADVDALLARGAREDRTIDFKLVLKLDSRDDYGEFLKDVTAFANAAGGTLLYGVREGEDQQEGVIVELPGLALRPDDVQRQIDMILRDGTDQRLVGVMHGAVPRDDGRFYYVVRVPPSSLAPHKVLHGRQTHRFFIRANTTTVEMDAQQIKSVALRASTADERARLTIEERRATLIQRAGRRKYPFDRTDQLNPDRDQLMLHVVPLFPNVGGWAYRDADVVKRLKKVSLFGWTSGAHMERFALEGMYVESPHLRHVAFLRSGALEFQEYDIVKWPASRPGTGDFHAWEVERAVISALDDCAGLTAAGLLPLPVVIGMTLASVGNSRIQSRPRDYHNVSVNDDDLVPISPFVLYEWDKIAEDQVRSMFDEMYQAWGVSYCWNFDQKSGDWICWDDYQRIDPPRRRFWLT